MSISKEYLPSSPYIIYDGVEDFKWSSNLQNFKWTFLIISLLLKPHTSHLGIELSRTGNFKRAKQSIAGKATVAFYEVIKMGRKHGLSVKIQFDLFDKMVKPILLYGCEVWGFSNNDILVFPHLMKN
jgi:hypothetical protein